MTTQELKDKLKTASMLTLTLERRLGRPSYLNLPGAKQDLANIKKISAVIYELQNAFLDDEIEDNDGFEYEEVGNYGTEN